VSILTLWSFSLHAMIIWLWGVNLCVFAQSSVNYSKSFFIFHKHIYLTKIWRVCCQTFVSVSALPSFKLDYWFGKNCFSCGNIFVMLTWVVIDGEEIVMIQYWSWCLFSLIMYGTRLNLNNWIMFWVLTVICTHAKLTDFYLVVTWYILHFSYTYIFYEKS
jgi:hypothetical protein